MNPSVRRISYLFLCAFPFVALVVASVRPLRTAGLSQVVGVVLFTALAVAAWVVGLRMIRLQAEGPGKLALAGVLLIAPLGIISLLWVGIGPPFQATLGPAFDLIPLRRKPAGVPSQNAISENSGDKPSRRSRER